MVNLFRRWVGWWYRTNWAIGLTVLLLALLPRVLAPAGQFSDPDAPAFWLPWVKEFADGLRTADVTKLTPAPHPGIPFLWLTAPMELILQKTQWHFQFPNPLEAYLMFLKIPVMVATSALAVIAWKLLRRILPRQWAVLTAVLFAVDPLYLAYSRYMHLEALLAGFVFCGLLAVWIGAREPSRRFLVYGAVLLTLATLTRVNGVVPLGFAMVAVMVLSRGSARDTWKSIGIAASVSIAMTVVIWPSVLFAPGKILAQQNLGLAMTLSAHEVPPNVDVAQPLRAMYYPFFVLVRDIPLVIILALVGTVAGIRPSQWRWRGLALFFALFLLVYYLALLIEPKKLERYFLPAVGPLALLAALGLTRVLAWRPTYRRLVVWGASLSIGLELLIVWVHAPYYQTYENVFARWIRPTPLARSQAMYFSWGEGIGEAAEYLRSTNNGHLPAVASWYAGNFCLYGRLASRDEYPFHPTTGMTCPAGLRLLANAQGAEYIILSRDQISQRIYPRLIDDIDRLSWQPERIITLNATPYLWIYRNQGGLAERYSLTVQ